MIRASAVYDGGVANSVSWYLPCLGLLDQVQHLHELTAFDAARFTAALGEELGGGDGTMTTLVAQLEGLRNALGAVDAFTRKAMGIRLTHILATAHMTPQFRTLLSTTVVTYAADTGLLRKRLMGSVQPALLDEIISTAEWVLTLRHALRTGIFAHTQSFAAAQLPWVEKESRDRSLPDNDRLRLRLTAVDLALLAKEPEILAAAPFDERLKKHPLPEEAPLAEESEDKRFSLIEID